MFYDDFEQHEKIEFVDFLYGHIFFLRKKKYIWVRSWIRSLKRVSDFFCCKLTFTFNEDQRNRVFELKNSRNLVWYNAIYMVENNFL